MAPSDESKFSPALASSSFFLCGVGAALLLFRSVRRRMRRIEFRGMSVVISGGSRGLGLELARLFAREGARLVLLARDIGELERAKLQLSKISADVLIFKCDIRERQQVDETVAAIIKERGCIDVLVNNAGTIRVAPFENLNLDDYKESMDVHVWGALYLTLAVVPHMRQRRRGRIINISSIGGLVAVPHLLSYTIGKFALTGLSQGLRAELAKDGVYVTTVAPGLMRTGSHVNAFFKGQSRKEFTWFALAGSNPFFSVSARRAARKIVEACRFGEARLIISLPARILHAAEALFPEVTAFGNEVATRYLPSPVAESENDLHVGWESRSCAMPSFATKLSDKMIDPNNENRS